MPARITRLAEAPAYVAPNHSSVATRRLQGLEAGPSEAFWVGHSVYATDGVASLSPTAQETVYYVLDGQFTLTIQEDGSETQTVLNKGDSVRMPKGTTRSVTNAADGESELLVIIAMPPAAS